MTNIKKPKLDVCDFYKKHTTVDGKPILPPKPDRLLTVFQKSMSILVRCGAIPNNGDNYVGTIIKLGAPSNKYDSLNIGDRIIFKLGNIAHFNP